MGDSVAFSFGLMIEVEALVRFHGSESGDTDTKMPRRLPAKSLRWPAPWRGFPPDAIHYRVRVRLGARLIRGCGVLMR